METTARPGPAQIGLFAATFLGAVFLVSVFAKVFDISAFAETVHARGLDAFLPAHAVAYVALALETFVGVLLVLNVRRLWVLLPVAALVAFLLWINLQAYLEWSRGDVPATAACGCFGNFVRRTPAEALWQDALLVLPALLLSFVGRPRGVPTSILRFRVGLAVALALAVVVLAAWAPRLPVDDLPFVTRLHPGVKVEALCVGKGEDETCLGHENVAPELATGRHVVVLADLADDAFAEAIRQRAGEDGAVVVIHAGTPAEEAAFRSRSGGASIDVRRAPYPLLRTLYRSLPRTFVVEDGTVVRTWNGLPPVSETSAP